MIDGLEDYLMARRPHRPKNPAPQQPPPAPQWQFRWGLVLIPAVILLVAWFFHGVDLSGAWQDIMDLLHVRNKQRYSMLAVLGLVTVAIVLITKVLSKKEDE